MQRIAARDKVDVLIIGAGAAGSVVAAKAAEADRRVLLLEAGPERKLSDLTSSQIWARKLKWGGAHVEEEGNLKIGHNFNAGFGTGGSALHQYAVWPRLHANDFTLHSSHGRGLDWPIDYAEMRPWYDRIQKEVGISGDARAEKWRPEGAPYPMPALPVFAQGKIIAKGFDKLGLSTAPIPLAVNSTMYHGRPACQFDGWCDAGCPIGALANPLVTYLPQAFKAGAEIRNDATVTRVLHDKQGRRVIGVEYVDAEGSQQIVYADTIVLAAFVVQSARLLLASRSDKHQRGLSNSNDLVGRYLMTHPAQAVYGLFAEETHPYLGPTGGQLICHDHYDNKTSTKGAFGSYQWLIANAAKPNDLLGIANSRPDIYGAALQPFLQNAAKHFGVMNFVGEDLAVAENRVQLSQQKDKFGVPLARTTHNIGAETIAMCDAGVAEGLHIFKAAGAKQAWAGPRVGMHVMGGTVMGNKAESSVTNSHGRCHELDNLYIAGPGVFPSSGAVNPTFTIHALALRTAEHLLKNH